MREYSFTRYLRAKRAVDNQALNERVWRRTCALLPPGPVDALEVGAGEGAMLERLVKYDLLPGGGRYTAVDAAAENTAAARRRFAGLPLPFELELVTADVYAFAQAAGRRAWDLLIAHAFLDLMDASRLLPVLFALLRPGGAFYFTINFDGLTALEPVVDPAFDELVIALYHRTMDERRAAGQPTGGSRAGRKLLAEIPAAGGEVVVAGASDWIVYPRRGGYPEDEAYFLHHMLHFFESSLSGRPELDPERFARWLARRRAQIDAAELSLIAHQIDVGGRVGP
jgi:SAM-dependent methyltransferase